MHVSIVLPCIYNGIQSDFYQHKQNTQHCMNGEAGNSRMYVYRLYMHLAFKELNNLTDHILCRSSGLGIASFPLPLPLPLPSCIYMGCSAREHLALFIRYMVRVAVSFAHQNICPLYILNAIDMSNHSLSKSVCYNFI